MSNRSATKEFGGPTENKRLRRRSYRLAAILTFDGYNEQIDTTKRSGMTRAMGDRSTSNAPIVQLLLTVSFAPSFDDITIIDLADIFEIFRAEFPVFQQVPRAGPMSFTLINQGPIFTASGGMPRVVFATEDMSSQILFQNDRLSLGWNRISSLEAADGYPGFAATLDRLKVYLNNVLEWGIKKNVIIAPNVGEILYTDAFSLTTSGDKPWAASDIFSMVNPAVTFPVMKFDFSWSELLPTGTPGYVDVSASGPAVSPIGGTMAMLETTARFDLSGDWTIMTKRFEEAHDAIAEIFERVVNPSASAK